MSNLHENGLPSNGDMAVIGENTQNSTPVSIQVLQNIYHELTGKSEEVSKSYANSFEFTLNDIEQLDHRISQTCEQYNVISQNTSYKVFYIDDTQDTFSSLSRFSAFSKGSSSCVESVLITYNLLITLPKTQKPQPYSISIRVVSKIAIQKKLRREVPSPVANFLKIFNNRSAIVSISYIDYSVARNILHCVDEWFKTIPNANNSSFLCWLQPRSALIPLVFRYLITSIALAFILFDLHHYLPSNATPFELGRFLLIFSISILAIYKITHYLGVATENSIDNWTQMSYISLTKGDEIEIKKAKESNSTNIRNAILKTISTIATGILSKVIISQIMHY